MKKALRRLSHWTLAIILMPIVWASFKVMVIMIPAVGAEGWRSWWVYLAGAVTYIILERIFEKPMRMYVFGHELTHALSGILSGAKIHSFKAGAKDGEVRLSKSNAFIALSPYIVPLYAMIVVCLYAILRHWWENPGLRHGFQFFLGAAVAFHLSLTVMAMHGRQPDLKILGFFLSGTLVLLGNALILGILCVSLFKRTPTFKQYAVSLTNETWNACKMSVVTTQEGIGQFKAVYQNAKISS